jgi:hypothetical protein
MAREELQRCLYKGDLAVFTGLSAVADIVAFTAAQLRGLFSPHDPEDAHVHFTPIEVAALLGQWKPRFIHDETAQSLVRAVIQEAGFSGDSTHYDLPKPRTAFPVGHLETGIAFAFPWHRDTWYSAPPQQINWWLPIFDVQRDNAMKFDLEMFGTPVTNDSENFDYYRVNRQRITTASQIKVETQSRPSAVDHVANDEFVMLLRPGSVMAFSGAHLHATIANTSDRSRYSLDFRTVDRRDVAQRIGAPLVDVRCTGTSLRDFLSVKSCERLDEELVRAVYGDPPEDAMLVFEGGQR